MKAKAKIQAPVRPPLPPGNRVSVGLCHHGRRALAALCRRYGVEQEAVLAAIVENFLSDACMDDTLAPCVACEARIITRTGQLPPGYYEKTQLQSPGFENEIIDGEAA